MQGLEDVAALSIIGTVGMITSIAVAVGKLYVMQPPQGAHTELVHKPNDINVSFVGAFSIVFTYGGYAALSCQTLYACLLLCKEYGCLN